MSNNIEMIAKALKNITTRLSRGGADSPVYAVNNGTPDNQGNVDLSYMARRDEPNDFAVTPTVQGTEIWTKGSLQVGGTNLYRGSFDWSGKYHNSSATVTKEIIDGETVLHIVQPNDGTYSTGVSGAYVTCPAELQVGDQFAVGVDVKGKGTLTRLGMSSSTDHTPLAMPLIVTDNWQRATNQMIAKSKGNIIIYFNSSMGDVDAYIRLVKIEKGTVATAWSPALEDIQSQLDAINAKFDALK